MPGAPSPADPKDDILRLGPYIPAIRQAGALWMEDPALLAAIMLRETLAGWAPEYEPKGSTTGSGDRAPRAYPDARASRLGPVRTVGTTVVPIYAGEGDERRQAGAEIRRLIVPGDGLGWGRGLMQIDWAGPFRAFIPPVGMPWPVEDQLRAASVVLSTARSTLRRWRGHVRYEQAYVAAYNAGPEAVDDCLRADKPPDTCTKGGNYATDVWGRRDALMKRRPDLFVLAPPAGGAA